MTQRNRCTRRLVLGHRKIIQEERDNVKAQVEPAVTAQPRAPLTPHCNQCHTGNGFSTENTNFMRVWALFCHQVLLILMTSIKQSAKKLQSWMEVSQPCLCGNMRDDWGKHTIRVKMGLLPVSCLHCVQRRQTHSHSQMWKEKAPWEKKPETVFSGSVPHLS